MNSEAMIQDLCAQGFHIIENLLLDTQCDALRRIAEKLYHQGLFRSAKIGARLYAHHNETIRSDQIFWLEQNESHPAIHTFLTTMRQLMHLLNEQLYLGLHELELHFANYQPGTYYKTHIDQFAAQKTRKISCVYYLNNLWQEDHGGELQMYNKEDQPLQKIAPTANRFICFNSDLPHEVLITHQPRYSITGWMKTHPMSLFS